MEKKIEFLLMKKLNMTYEMVKSLTDNEINVFLEILN